MSTRKLLVGQTPIGGDAPIAIQTMWKDRLSEDGLNEATIARIQGLYEMGCSLLRFAVPDMAAASTLGRLAEMTLDMPHPLPLVADIHFDYKIALRCMDFPLAKIRINPGNIGSKDKVKAVLDKAGEKGLPIRIGVNAGSLPAGKTLLDAALDEIKLFDEFHFTNYLVSAKASSVRETIEANRLLAKALPDVPLHIGVTEAGPLVAGTVRNTIALYTLLSENIGDTIRVSLSDTMENEVIAAKEILRASAPPRELSPGIKIISCPRCGRNSFDTHAFTTRWLERLYKLQSNASIAIMGCVVNGPGEARNADLGITGVGDKVLLFKHGEVIRTIKADEADAVFAEELSRL
ncbi:MAG: (E)-4-hydroxy-3-methylbut-2-enyl-diphosphate synthase [Spirochaetaceae bacterium]|jgi:(E)-4-hydroxy-3-methylbut-2-enyl-diphosphate synthase|nr:(E)-4-hydroxy-3-methylbut-2-enyl-diphosphate synthase [Spirochaetaceae bacterium]